MPTDLPVALVTGARRGIGKASALALARRGFAVALVDREDDEEMASTVREFDAAGAQACFVRCDIARLDEHEQAVRKVFGRWGRIDCLVNNAGVQAARGGDLLDVTPDEFDGVMAVNLRGTFFFAQRVARLMGAASPSARSAAAFRTVITITSANAWLARSDRPAYSLSKAALSMLNRLLAVRLAPLGVHAYEVRPGLIKTDMNRAVWDTYTPRIEEGLTLLRRWGTPDDVAQVVGSLATGALPYTTGSVVDVDGGLMLPRSTLEPLPAATVGA